MVEADLAPAQPALLVDRPFADQKESAALSKAAQKQDMEDAWRRVGHLTETFSQDECTNYFRNAGYASIKNDML
jgi:hypothetical protein